MPGVLLNLLTVKVVPRITVGPLGVDVDLSIVFPGWLRENYPWMTRLLYIVSLAVLFGLACRRQPDTFRLLIYRGTVPWFYVLLLLAKLIKPKINALEQQKRKQLV